jgi:hypothetical protein
MLSGPYGPQPAVMRDPQVTRCWTTHQHGGIKQTVACPYNRHRGMRR